MPDIHSIIIDVIGEGKTDIGKKVEVPTAEPPTSGVVPILLHKLCGEPAAMRVRRLRLAFLQVKGLNKKVQLARIKAKAEGSAGLVVVMDSEGDHPKVVDDLRRWRDAGKGDFPMAVGVAHPCIEAWLLADPRAIRRGMELAHPITDAPEAPEDLPAPKTKLPNQPKLELARCAGRTAPLAAADTTRIADAIRNFDTLRERCPAGFAPFAAEVEERIRPLFAG